MLTVCKENKCAGCMACLEICPRHAISIKTDVTSLNAVIDESRCVNCGLCHNLCQSNKPAELLSPVCWWQGWAKDSEIRKDASSGGIATSIEQMFVSSGGIVCSCAFENGKFGFRFASHIEDVKLFSGSKYVKSNPVGIYKRIKELLNEGKRVLFVGLPCQVSAVVNFVGESLRKNLYTIDLICHGTPLPEVLEMFLTQYEVKLIDLDYIGFRTKTAFQVNDNHRYFSEKGTKDSYTISFLNAISYTENCYECKYATINRVSDVTLGDSWGSELEGTIQNKGISLILCQTEKGKELIQNSDLELIDVNLERAKANNHQLVAPSKKPRERSAFFDDLKKGESFDKVVRKYYKKQYAKQKIKGILIKLKLVRGGKNKL